MPRRVAGLKFEKSQIMNVIITAIRASIIAVTVYGLSNIDAILYFLER